MNPSYVVNGRAGRDGYQRQRPVELSYLQANYAQPKILYPDITWQSQFSHDTTGLYANNTMYFLPTGDLWILAVLNSPVSWWYSWRRAQHGKDEALRFFTAFVEAFPIPSPSESPRENSERFVSRLKEFAANQNSISRTVLDWLHVDHEIEKPSLKLQALVDLDSAAALKSLRDEHTRTIEPARTQAAEALQLERQLTGLVNEAYGLTPDEVALCGKPPHLACRM